MIINSIFKKPTIFSIAGSLTITLGVPFGVYTLTLERFKAVLGIIIFFYVIVAGIIVLLDRFLIKRCISLLKINILELLISLMVLYFYFT